MSVGSTKVFEIISYLNQYKEKICEEGYGDAFTLVVLALNALKKYIDEGTGTFPKASSTYHADRIIRYLEGLELTSSAITSARVFKKVVMDEVNTYYGLGVETSPFPNKEIVAPDGLNYELLTENSYCVEYIKRNLLCAFHCYKELRDDLNAKRLEALLTAIEPPVNLSFAFRYLFTAFKNNNISFTIHHPRFIEILTDLKDMVNKNPTEDVMWQGIKKWISILKPAP